MKSRIALFLLIAVLLAFALPIQSISANMDSELENAIKIAKTKFTIPEDYKFSSSIGMNGTKKIYYLNWRSPDTTDATYINASVDENGMILNYNKYTPYDYKQAKKLPKLSRQEAKAKADVYIARIAPGLLKELQYEESYQRSILDYSYYLNYHRVVNGAPFYNDSVYISINRDTGELQDYSRSWTDGLDFPSAANPISLKEAEAAYTKDLGLRLIYKFSENDGVLRAYPVYVPIYDNNNYGIDAFTGEQRRLSNNYYYGREGDVGFNTMKQEAASAAGGIQLSPEELKAVQEAAKLISQDEAERITRAAKFLSITDGYKLQDYYLGPNWPDKNEYAWSLQFNKPADENTLYDEYIHVTINAKSSVITGFYKGVPFTAGAKPKNDMVKAKAEADAFLSQYYPQFYNQLEYDSLASESNYNGRVPYQNYSFTYARLVNGVPFPDNGVNINYDNMTGTISSFNLNWYNITFPPVEKVIGVEAASANIFKDVGLELEYKFAYQEDVNNVNDMNRQSAKVLLVYCLKPNKPLILDANTGALLNYDGTEYKQAVKVNYTDIKGNIAEKQITVLTENGIYLEGREFKPGIPITQLDFMTLLSQTLNYYGPIITAKSPDKDIDDLYAYLRREGIVKDGEKAPGNTVTREEAVKYLVRALKYDKVADLKDIFIIGFKDKASIAPDLAGYIAIASGLGIIDGGNAAFRPKDKTTRGETAIMIFNYLQS